MRPQTFFVFIAAICVLILRSMADSNGIFGGLSWLVGLSSGVVVITLCHWARKFYLDHDGTDMHELFKQAPPGHRLVAMALFFLAFAVIFASTSAHAQSVSTYVPPQAKQYIPALSTALHREWPDVPDRGYVGALIEHESGCFSMKSKCWNPRSELRTKREHGVGFSQFTVAYRDDGTTRFDKLAELAAQYPQLRDLNWSNVMTRPDLQLTATVLGVRDTWAVFKGAPEALEFADAGWNGGIGDVQRERRTCKLSPGCDPGRWWGNVERYCMKSKAALYGTRSACDINRNHVRDVWVRTPKYRTLV